MRLINITKSHFYNVSKNTIFITLIGIISQNYYLSNTDNCSPTENYFG
jgi:hypothetical protein